MHCSWFNGVFRHFSPELVSLPHLFCSDLSGYSLVGSLPADVDYSPLSSLSALWLPRNQLSGSLPAALAALTGLQSVWLQENQFSGPLPANWSALTGLKQL
jgi:hypothetical protein